jgi:uncharacterized protein YodC (DUF2158 family)
MSDQKFAAGDVVQSTVGGRKMTVHGYDQFGNVVCRWFDSSGQLQDAIFSEAVLKKVD